jgi:hypothetical protein
VIKQIMRVMPEGIRRRYHNHLQQKAVLLWERGGTHNPPTDAVKQRVVAGYQRQYRVETLVETGTFLGDMVYAQLNNFSRIYSIELDEALWQKAVKRFKKHSKVTILKGDSGIVLNDIVPRLDQPALFWLDGRYSGGETAKGEKECPFYEELKTIFPSRLNHVLLIDDARCFNGTGDYPTVKNVIDCILTNRPGSTVELKVDIIRAVLG